MKKLDKKVNLNIFITRTVISSLFYVGYAVLLIIPKDLFGEDIIKTIVLVIGGVIVFFLLIFNFILPFFVYKCYGYEFKDEELLIHKGVFFRKVTYIPVKRIQHLQKSIGPVQMLLNLSTIQVFTAGSTDYILGLNSVVADELINEINEKLNLLLKKEEKNE